MINNITSIWIFLLIFKDIKSNNLQHEKESDEYNTKIIAT